MLLADRNGLQGSHVCSIATSPRRDFASQRGALRDLLAWSIGARKHVFYVLVAYVSVIFSAVAVQDRTSTLILNPAACRTRMWFRAPDPAVRRSRRYRFMSIMAALVILLLLA
jgi:hypothetical protein